jgi:HNH endonuclease/AP2 domain
MTNLVALKGANEAPLITPDELKKVLHYNPETGVWTWLVTRGRYARLGTIAGSQLLAKRSNSPYQRIKINGRHYLSHRLAFLYMLGQWPINQPDHINTNTLDNRWKNLREATPSQNQANRRARKDNKTGFKGVYFCKTSKKFKAETQVNGKTIRLGYFLDAKSAADAYKKSVEKHFGEFARTA